MSMARECMRTKCYLIAACFIFWSNGKCTASAKIMRRLAAVEASTDQGTNVNQSSLQNQRILKALHCSKSRLGGNCKFFSAFAKMFPPSGGQSLPGSVSGHLAHQHGLGLTLSLPSATPQSGIKPGTLTTCE